MTLVKTRHQKGKALERTVAKKLNKIFSFAYARADSGSGKWKKEDVSLPDSVPFHIECKHQAEAKINYWWDKLLYDVPEDKVPVLVYKLNYVPIQVYMRLEDLLGYLFDVKQDTYQGMITLDFEEWVALIDAREQERNREVESNE